MVVYILPRAPPDDSVPACKIAIYLRIQNLVISIVWKAGAKSHEEIPFKQVYIGQGDQFEQFT